MGTFSHDPRPCRRGRDRGHGRGGPVRPLFSDADAPHGFGDKPDYKTAALCKQVRRALSLALTGDCADPVLQSLVVDDVLPAPHAGRLLVRVLLPATGGPGGPTAIDVLTRLAQVEGLLRAKVGEAIVRKRTPELAFVVIPLLPPAPAADGESEVSHD
jgi:hypothetical protein